MTNHAKQNEQRQRARVERADRLNTAAQFVDVLVFAMELAEDHVGALGNGGEDKQLKSELRLLRTQADRFQHLINDRTQAALLRLGNHENVDEDN